MKKVLFGMLALSLLTFSAQPDLESVVEGTNVFEKSGTIRVDGSLVSTVPGVKYVVYASVDGTFSPTAADAELTLPAIILTQISTTNILEGTPKNIYVKKVNSSGNDVEALSPDEKVSFKLSGLDPAYTTQNTKVVTTEKAEGIPMTAFLSKEKLIELGKAAFADATKVAANTYGELEVTLDGKVKVYRNPNRIGFSSPVEGELNVGVIASDAIANSSSMPFEQAKKFEDQLKTPVTGQVSIQVQVQ